MNNFNTKFRKSVYRFSEGDWIQIDNQQQWPGSLEFRFSMHKHLGLESWVSQLLENGNSIFTLRLSLILSFSEVLTQKSKLNP